MPNTPLTIAAAARLCHCDRRTLQRAIHAGRLHLDADHALSREELLATGYLVAETPQQTPPAMPQETPLATPPVALLERLTIAVEGVWQELRALREQQYATPRQTPPATPLEAPKPTPQGPPAAPDLGYDPTKYVLGRLCRRKHAYGTTGKTLLRLPALQCRQCQAERARERRAARRAAEQAQPQR
jgi:hypothetical protein